MNSFYIYSFSLEIYLSIAILIALLFNVFTAVSTKNNNPIITEEVFYQTIFILIIGFFISINFPITTSMMSLSTYLINDFFALYIKSFILLIVIIALIIGQDYLIKSKINFFEFYTLILLIVLSLCLSISCGDFLSLYLALEMQAISFYILCALHRDSVYSTEAGLKYFILGSFMSSILLAGIALIYGTLGTINFNNIFLLLSNLDLNENNLTILYVAFFFILISILFKLTVAPFHIWAPDIYEGAPLNVTIFFVLVPKIVLIPLYIRIINWLFSSFFIEVQPILFLFAILTIIISAFLALKQTRLKRLMIYSSINHVGFLLFALAIGSSLSLTAALYYLFFYIITNILVWSILSILTINLNQPVYISDLAGLKKVSPFLAWALAIGFLSLAGIPPFVGFSMKYYLFQSALGENYLIISLILILLTVFSSFYYIRLVKIIFFEKPKEIFINFETTNKLVYFLISASLFCILFGFFNSEECLLYSYKIILGLFLK